MLSANFKSILPCIQINIGTIFKFRILYFWLQNWNLHLMFLGLMFLDIYYRCLETSDLETTDPEVTSKIVGILLRNTFYLINLLIAWLIAWLLDWLLACLLDGWIWGWMDGLMDGWMDGLVDWLIDWYRKYNSETKWKHFYKMTPRNLYFTHVVSS